MRFTKYHSMNDILAYPHMEEYLKIFYSEFLLEMFPKELADQPIALAEWYGKTPWGEPFTVISDQLMDAANLILDIEENKTRRCITLWDPEESEWNLEKEKKGEKDSVFLLAPVPEERELRCRPAVIICPGGGYEAVCFSGEGTPVLRFMEANGYCAFILKYRVSPCRYPAPQADLALAIQYVRAHAQEYGVNPGDITLIGASAGGHLCASEAALYEDAAETVYREMAELSLKTADYYQKFSARPDKLVLSYPVISFTKEPHEGSFRNLTGGKEELRELLSVENLVKEDYPPTFVWACEDDDCVPPSNARHMAEALKDKGVRHECHIYPAGGHGCGLAFTKSAAGWSRSMLDFCGTPQGWFPQIS